MSRSVTFGFLVTLAAVMLAPPMIGGALNNTDDSTMKEASWDNLITEIPVVVPEANDSSSHNASAIPKSVEEVKTSLSNSNAIPEVRIPLWNTSSSNPEAAAFSRGDDGDLELCDCPDIMSTQQCTCTGRSGQIENPYNGSAMVLLSYTMDAWEPGSSIAVYFRSEDISLSKGLCEVTIGDKTFIDNEELNNVHVVSTRDEIAIKVYGYIPQLCKYKFQYYVYSENTSVIVLNDTEGFLTPPADDLEVFGYRPFTQILWILQPLDGEDDHALISDFKFSFDFLDLGVPSLKLHSEGLKSNFTSGDFILIGTGDRLLGGSDVMFYGRRDAGDSVSTSTSGFKDVKTFGNVSHVFFRSTSTSFDARGFNVSYQATVMRPTTTPPPLTTAFPPSPEEVQTSLVASIEGASMDTSMMNQTIDSFKESIANMSTQYAKMHSIPLQHKITPSSVEVFEATTCNPIYCNPMCVAFNFSVASMYPNGSWVFTADVLYDMIWTPELQYAIKQIGADCKVCDEDPNLNLWLYISVPVVIVIFGLLISLALWYMGMKSGMDESRKKYEQEIADRRDDNRRRSSGDISILGLGGRSFASRGSVSSRRFTMPFPKAKRDDDGDIHQNEGIDEVDGDGDVIDMSDFKEYDPDLGRIDPAEFGMPSEFLNGSRIASSSSYGNPCFEGDDERAPFQSLQRGESIATTTGTDSEDSDGGAVTFSTAIKMKTKQPATSIQASVDVHRADDVHSLSQVGGDGETAL